MILQLHLPYDVFARRPLPGIAPLGNDPWFLVDDAYAAQMAYRRQLIAMRLQAVVATDAASPLAIQDMLDAVLANLPNGFDVRQETIKCPDGTVVAVDRENPFATLGQVLQEDVCLLEKRGDEHVLTGAVLCFPASWRLSEKIGHPLSHIHVPVPEYDDSLARRVQRLFDGVRPGQPLWRFNALWYDDPELHQPRSASTPRELSDRNTAPFMRSERQVIWRLANSGAVLFTIHSFVVPRDAARAAFPSTQTA